MITCVSPAILGVVNPATLDVSGLVNYFRFVDLANVLVDSMGNGDLTVDEGTPAFSADTHLSGVGSAEYDGASNHNWPHATLTDNRTFSISCWFKMDNITDSGKTILGEWGSGTNNFALQQVADKVRLGIYRTTASPSYATSAVVLTANTWHHCVIRMEGSQLGSISVDNETPVDVSTAGQWRTPGATWQIGNETAGANDFKGHVQELALIDRVISDTEIGNIYNGGDGIELTLPE